jgi:adenosylhomocysteine nucleosidase
MPLELNAITAAFGLSRTSDEEGAPWRGRVGGSEVTAIHIGMGPALTRKALVAAFETIDPDHVMIAGICGGLRPDLAVGTLINPEVVIDHASGATYTHSPPGDIVRAGKLVTTEEATLDVARSERFCADGCVGVDMETSAVAEVCEPRGCPWSVYRCIGDRYFDGLLDERIVAATNQDGSGNMAEIQRLLASDPGLSGRLQRLAHDSALAARLAAEAAVRGCLALDA